MVTSVVLHRSVLDRDAEERGDLTQVRAVLVLLGLREDDKAATGLDEANESPQLRRRRSALSPRRSSLRTWASSHGGAPAREVPSSASAVRRPSVSGSTTKSRRRSSSAAVAYELSPGCCGCIRAATSGRVVQACWWASSTRTRTVAGRVTEAAATKSSEGGGGCKVRAQVHDSGGCTGRSWLRKCIRPE